MRARGDRLRDRPGRCPRCSPTSSAARRRSSRRRSRFVGIGRTRRARARVASVSLAGASSGCVHWLARSMCSISASAPSRISLTKREAAFSAVGPPWVVSMSVSWARVMATYRRRRSSSVWRSSPSIGSRSSSGGKKPLQPSFVGHSFSSSCGMKTCGYSRPLAWYSVMSRTPATSSVSSTLVGSSPPACLVGIEVVDEAAEACPSDAPRCQSAAKRMKEPMFATARCASGVFAPSRSSTVPVRSSHRSRIVCGPSRQVSSFSSLEGVAACAVGASVRARCRRRSYRPLAPIGRPWLGCCRGIGGRFSGSGQLRR